MRDRDDVPEGYRGWTPWKGGLFGRASGGELDAGALGYHGDARRTRRDDFTGVGPRNYRPPDRFLEEDVSEALARHPDVDASDVTVRVENGEATLEGTVPDRWTKRLAEEAAEVPGVREVHNHLRVRRAE